jgi:hypothetical protein
VLNLAQRENVFFGQTASKKSKTPRGKNQARWTTSSASLKALGTHWRLNFPDSGGCASLLLQKPILFSTPIRL